MRAQHLVQAPLHRSGWPDFLQKSTLTLGFLLLASALICWIAANWVHATVFQKLFGTQAVLITLVLLVWRITAVSGAQGGRQFSIAASMMGAAGVAVGALFALIGQIYQTRADPWELFFLWAVLLIPWLLAVRTVVLALLCATLLNVAAVLYLVDMPAQRWWTGGLSGWAESGLLLTLLNLALLILWEHAIVRLNDRWRIGPRTLSTAGLTWLLIANIALPETDVWMLTIPSVLAMSLMAWFYTRRLRDLALVCFAALTAFSLIAILFVDWLGEDGLLLTIALLIGLAGWGLRRLGTLIQTRQPTMLQEPWFLSLLRLAIVMITASLTVFFIFPMLDPHTGTLWTVGALFGAAGLGLSRLCRSGIRHELGLTLIVAGLLLIGIEVLFSDGSDATVRVAAILLVGTLLYLWVRSAALRFLCVTFVLGIVLVLTWPTQNGSGLLDTFDPNHLAMSIPLTLRLWWLAVAAVLALALGIRSKSTMFWTPLAWGLVCLTQLIAALAPAPSWFELTVTPAPALIVLWLACAMLPVVLLAVLLAQQQDRSHVLRLGAPVVLAVASLAWMGAPGIAMALLWIILGYGLARRGLLVFGVLALLAYLARFYYLLDSSLLQKSWILGLTGAWLLSAWFGLRYLIRRSARHRPATGVAQVRPVRHLWREAGLIAGLLLTLIVANTGIYQREQILATGQRVVLALAPVDPRSLIQGDYMALNFAVTDQLSVALQSVPAAVAEKIEDQHSGYLVLAPDDHGIHQLAGIKARIDDKAATESSDTIALEFQHRGGQVSIATNAWFFPEGQAADFAQAHYGAFRVDQTGQAILTHLLDEQRQILPN
ncbi:GDYXXLXY domain-containing protein [Alcaligenaceae bacterium CGII-47]|nr:GDYXXLXY domain-containing protein [Alcaligenaceae bacterium CGII-47]